MTPPNLSTTLAIPPAGVFGAKPGGVRAAFAGAFFLAIYLFAFSAPGQTINVNESIAHFCEQHLGQKVGSGECASLASQALHQVGLKRKFKDSPGQGDYVWGKLVLVLTGTGSDPAVEGQTNAIARGDIIQFRDALFRRGRHTVHCGHHTAVVDAVYNDGSSVTILQENFNGKQFVTAMNLDLLDLKSGWIRVYQP